MVAGAGHYLPHLCACRFPEVTMDPIALAGMIFVLLLIAMIGGFLLLIPVSRRLGAVLDYWLKEKTAASSLSSETAQARALLESVATRLETLEEKQVFMEELLSERRATPRLTPHFDAESGEEG